MPHRGATDPTQLAVDRLLRAAEENLRSARELLRTGNHDTAPATTTDEVLSSTDGIFDGVSMHGNDGQVYPVPENYSSKSKLVEGDLLKASVMADGRTVFKQIGPVTRAHLQGNMIKGEDGTWLVDCHGQFYRVLPASVTFFKLMAGDRVGVLVPKDSQGTWAAIDSVIARVGNA